MLIAIILSVYYCQCLSIKLTIPSHNLAPSQTINADQILGRQGSQGSRTAVGNVLPAPSLMKRYRQLKHLLCGTFQGAQPANEHIKEWTKVSLQRMMTLQQLHDLKFKGDR